MIDLAIQWGAVALMTAGLCWEAWRRAYWRGYDLGHKHTEALLKREIKRLKFREAFLERKLAEAQYERQSWQGGA